jgi:4-amino-4-deoxy-L-arabinose transferase-like glycosyltransferase
MQLSKPSKNAILSQPTLPQPCLWLKDILFLSLVLGILYFLFLGNRPLFVPDEGRYAEIAREMLTTKDFITPHLNGIKYFEKPVLFYWLESAAIYLGGLNLWSIRSVNVLLGLMGCLATYGTARCLYNRETGILAALILGTSTLYFVMSHMVSLDLPVTVFIMLTLYGFLLGIHHAPGLSRRLFLWGAAIAAASAVLTKGLIGLVFPLMIIGTWMLLTKEWRLLTRIYLPSCLLIFFLVATPWHILVQQHNPEFFYFYFINQHFLRYTSMDVGHYQPLWFFIPNLILGFFPWIVFLPQTIAGVFSSRLSRDTSPLSSRSPSPLPSCGLIAEPSAAAPHQSSRAAFSTETEASPPQLSSRAAFSAGPSAFSNSQTPSLFFLIWAVLIFSFFSFSKSKLIPYILPVFPPLAILTAHYLQQAIQNKPRRGIKLSFIALFCISILCSIAFLIFLKNNALPNPSLAKGYLYSAASLLTLGASIACFYAYRSVYQALLVTFIATWLFLLLSLTSMTYIDTRTIQPFARLLNPILTAQDEVIAYNQYFQDLPFYLQRRITILNWKNELEYGMQHQDTSTWMINDETFWQRWHSPRRLFVIMSKNEYQKLIARHPAEKYYILSETLNNILLSNQQQ